MNRTKSISIQPFLFIYKENEKVKTNKRPCFFLIRINKAAYIISSLIQVIILSLIYYFFFFTRHIYQNMLSPFTVSLESPSFREDVLLGPIIREKNEFVNTKFLEYLKYSYFSSGKTTIQKRRQFKG